MHLFSLTLARELYKAPTGKKHTIAGLYLWIFLFVLVKYENRVVPVM